MGGAKAMRVLEELGGADEVRVAFNVMGGAKVGGGAVDVEILVGVI